MGVKAWRGCTVFDAAVDRMVGLYEAGHRVVVSFSAGKDSGVALEVCIVAAELTGRLPVDVVMRDEEIMLPGTYEYAERVAARPEVDFRWLVARQPVLNIYNRKAPYFWVFDPTLPPERWVRPLPERAEIISEQNIGAMTTPMRFPPAPGKELFTVMGLRVQESTRRRFGLHTMQRFYTRPRGPYKVRNAWPIYDWTDGDVWLAHRQFGWDYNRAYDTLYKMRVPRAQLRIAPPTMTAHGVGVLAVAARAWPHWFDRVAERLPGVRLATLFGRRAVEPQRRRGETWEDCFYRVCVEDAPASWIAERALKARDLLVNKHKVHSTMPFPDVKPCLHCTGGASIASWKKLAYAMYNGDPMSLKTDKVGLPYIEPEFFRPGSGTWGGQPQW
jgi:predicted phosphoadenosine phosphosulfate sulfurtransferase